MHRHSPRSRCPPEPVASPLRRLPNAARRAVLARMYIALASSIIAGACGVAPPSGTGPAPNDRRADIEHDIDATLARCNAIAPHTGAALKAAVGVLVFPTIVNSGVNDELAGDGALRVAHVFTSYHLLSAVPPPAMPERVHALIFMFTNFDALARFQRASVWPDDERDFAVPLIGADGLPAPRSRGAAVLAIALGERRLLPGFTLKDLRVTPLDPMA